LLIDSGLGDSIGFMNITYTGQGKEAKTDEMMISGSKEGEFSVHSIVIRSRLITQSNLDLSIST